MPDLSAVTIPLFWVFLQVLVRFSALIAIAPVFGATQVPAQVKVWLCLILSAVVTPIVAPAFPTHEVPSNLYDLASTIVLQAMVGLLMGFVVSMLLQAFQLAGTLLDLQVGFTQAQTFNPEIGELAAPLSQFQYMYALLLFLLANGHHILLIALTKSFTMLPISALDFGSAVQLKMIADVTFGALVNGLKIAAPAAAVLLVCDVSFAFLSRAMPQLNIFYVGMPVKVIAGLAIVVIVLPATAIFAGQMVAGSPDMLGGLISAAKK